MLVLTRKPEEKVLLGHKGPNALWIPNHGKIIVTLVEIQGDRVRLGFEAPDWIRILREEIALSAPPPKKAFSPTRISLK